MVEDSISALRSIQNKKNKREYEIYRGLTGVPENATILGLKEGDKIEMPLSAFTPSETWATEMAEFTEEGEGVMIKVVPGAQTTASTSKYDPKADGYWANAFEVVTAGEFEVVSIEDPENEPKIITMRQTAVFDTENSTYENILKPEDRQDVSSVEKEESARLSGNMANNKKIGTVTEKPVENFENEEFVYSESGLPSNYGYYDDGKAVARRSMPVFEIDGKKIAFGPKKVGRIEPKPASNDVEILPVNPYVVSGKSETSEEGQEAALLWFSATAGQVTVPNGTAFTVDFTYTYAAA
jgi:hypothetical protein